MATVITKIGVRDSSGTGYDTRDIGAKSQNIEIGYDKNGKVILDVDTTAPTSTKTLSKALYDMDAAESAPVNHRWTDSESVDYGKADATHYGHIKLGTGLVTDASSSSVTYGATGVDFAASGVSAANKAVQANDSRLSDARKNPNAVTFKTSGGASSGTTYDGSVATIIDYSTVGAAPSSHTSVPADASTLGHVKPGTGLSASSGVLSVSYGVSAGTACAGNDSRLSDSRTPKSHAATSAATYGAGTASQYGHIMLTDTYSVTTPSASTNGAATSIGASAYALQTAYKTLKALVDSSLQIVSFDSSTGELVTKSVS